MPSEKYKAQQAGMAETLVSAGLNPEQMKTMFLLPLDAPTGEKKKDL
ncbi:MAG: hypothetical protein ACYCSP_07570 [Acidobacteriaceae bacterium]